MRINQLIEELTDIQSILGEDAEVRLAVQPNWPFQHHISGLVTSEELDEGVYDEEDRKTNGPTVWIAEGRQIGYFTKRAWENL